MAAMLGSNFGNGSSETIRRERPRDDDPTGSESLTAARSSPLALVSMIEGEIIPRLLLAHREDRPRPDIRLTVDGPAIEHDEAERFARLALDHEAYALLRNVEIFLARGVTVETIFIDLLGRAARQLGDWWESDICDFVDVTMGLWRLQEIVHELAARIPGAAEGRGGDRRALFSVPPGEQHGFGSLMVDEFFRRAGWNTWNAPAATLQEMVDLVGRRWFELIGLTVSCESHIEDLPDLIQALRKASRNEEIIIMVGGRVFSERPDLAESVGADGTAPDARQAVLRAEALIELVTARSSRYPAGRA